MGTMMKKTVFLLWGWCALLCVHPSLLRARHTPDRGGLHVATFNLRHDNPGDGENRWDIRKDSVATLIAGQGWQVIGMQEVLHGQLLYLLKQLPAYRHVGVGRDDGKTKGEYAPILYDTTRLQLLDHHTFWLSQYPDSAGFIGWDGACTRIATWARFKDKDSGQTFLFVNTHFDHVGKEAMRNSARLIQQKIRQIAQGLPVILTGDFNVDDSSEPYRILTRGIPALQDACKACLEKEGVDYTYHDFGRLPEASRAKIDFIFTSPEIKILKTGILPENHGTQGHISDHNPHWAVMQFP